MIRMLRFHVPRKLLKRPVATWAHASGSTLLHALHLGLCLPFSGFGGFGAVCHLRCCAGLLVELFAQTLHFAFRVVHAAPTRAVKALSPEYWRTIQPDAPSQQHERHRWSKPLREEKKEWPTVANDIPRAGRRC